MPTPTKNNIELIFSKLKELSTQNELLTQKINNIDKKVVDNNKTLNTLNKKIDNNTTTLNKKIDNNTTTLNSTIKNSVSVSNTYGSAVTLNTSPTFSPSTANWYQSTINLASQNTGQTLIVGPLAISGSSEYQLCMISNLIQPASASITSLYMSIDYGQTWNVISNPNVSNVKDTYGYSLAVSNDGKYMTYMVTNCVTLCSSDYGSKWKTIPAPTQIINIPSDVPASNISQLLLSDQNSMAMSSSGQYQISVSYAANVIYMSSNYGSTWNMYYDPVLATTGAFSCNAMESSGQIQVLTSFCSYNSTTQALIPGGGIFISNNYGAVNSWSQVTSSSDNMLNNQIWVSVAMNASSGQYMTALSLGTSSTTYPTSEYDPIYILELGTPGYLYTSSDYGKTWSPNTKLGKQVWESVSISSTGRYQTAVTLYGVVYTSSNYGSTWIENSDINNQLNSSVNTENVVVSSNGYNQALSVYWVPNGSTYTSGSIYYTNTTL